MPLSFSPEQTFILLLLELVLCGLSLVVVVWMQFREHQPDTQLPAVRCLTVAFSLLVVAFGFEALFCRLAAFHPSVDSLHIWLWAGGELTRLVGAGSLAAGVALSGAWTHPRWRRGAVVAIAGVTAASFVMAAVRLPADAAGIGRSIVPVTSSRVGETLVLTLGVALGRTAGLRLASAVMVLAIGQALALIAAWRPMTVELMWGLGHLATLAGLVLSGLALERYIRAATPRFFLRLNLTFIGLASSLILAITQIERRQFIDIAALQAQDVVEFVRGHMLYYTNRGESAENALTHADVIRKLVAEFGRYPDLRRVIVSLQGHTMALAIDPDGIIDQELWRGERPVRPPVSTADFLVTRVGGVPIVSSGRVIGRVDLDHGLERINEQIGWQTQVIFGVFTLFVSVGVLLIGWVVAAADRTIRRQYDEIERTGRQLSRARRLASIGSVVDGVAHEINNPAGIILARTDYLLAVAGGDARAGGMFDDLETIRRQAVRISKTVKDLLTFTHPVPVWHEVFQIQPVLESAMALVQPLVANRAIVIESRVESRLPPVCGDHDRLEQVMVNLLTNAIQAIRDEGRVIVTASPAAHGDGVEVVVRDTGDGIRPEHLDFVFDPFFTTKAVGRGTGLGLSIAYGIVRDHGGSIDVHSEPGGGAEFRVALPRAGAPDAGPPAGGGLIGRPGSRRDERSTGAV